MSEDEDDIAACVREVLARRAAAKAMPGLTVRQLYDEYAAAQSQRKNWWATDHKLRPFVAQHAARDALGLAVSDWTKYAGARLKTKLPGKAGAAGEVYSVGTVNVELGSVKAMFNWATAQGLLRFNPIAAARRFKNRRGRDTAPKEWEIGRFLDACRRPEHTLMVLAAADVGLRLSEIRQLRHDWIDHERKTVTLPGYVCKNGRGGVVPCTQRFLDAAARLPRHIRLPQVLVSERSQGAYCGFQLETWWVQIRERAGVEAAPGDKAVHLHDLRAACATNALDRGVRLETVSRRILRHSDLGTTEIYLRGRDVGNLDQAIEAMEAGIARDQRRGPRGIVAKEPASTVEVKSGRDAP